MNENHCKDCGKIIPRVGYKDEVKVIPTRCWECAKSKNNSIK